MQSQGLGKKTNLIDMTCKSTVKERVPCQSNAAIAVPVGISPIHFRGDTQPDLSPIFMKDTFQAVKCSAVVLPNACCKCRVYPDPTSRAAQGCALAIIHHQHGNIAVHPIFKVKEHPISGPCWLHPSTDGECWSGCKGRQRQQPIARKVCCISKPRMPRKVCLIHEGYLVVHICQCACDS